MIPRGIARVFTGLSLGGKVEILARQCDKLSGLKRPGIQPSLIATIKLWTHITKSFAVIRTIILETQASCALGAQISGASRRTINRRLKASPAFDAGFVLGDWGQGVACAPVTALTGVNSAMSLGAYQ